jgi:glutamate-1-semialdehyde 2,1-aminomutase
VKIVAIVQARMGSTRLPGKVMMSISGYTLIELLLMRLSESIEVDEIVVATSEHTNNKALIDHVRLLGFRCEEGSENDVLERYYDTAVKCSADVIIRITADCPLIDSAMVDECVKEFKRSGVDYFSNNHPESFPDGLDVEVFSFSALSQAHLEASSNIDREHVTPYIRDCNKFSIGEMVCNEDHSDKRWTVDEPADFNVVKNIFDSFLPNVNFSWLEVLKLFDSRPELFEDNKDIVRNEGSVMGTGQKLWRRATKVIPGGNMLLSKRSELFLPGQWPSYFDRAKGCSVWDLDGKQYTDMSIMGIGTNILGYGNDEVDEAVRVALGKGNMSTLNCPEEVFLAEKLVDMHPWSDMVKFARSGGEANAIAIRIARAASGKDNVAICGYHGWHDWYLAANLGDEENLTGHLLPGLDPKGVPSALSGTVFPFQYNEFEQLENIVATRDIGVIKMEVVRNAPPEDDFLQKVRKLATDNGIVLIFDECTSGFRESFGGIHKNYNVQPDIAMFGKALGNGHAITAILGKREIMNEAQATFISSTFWTERVGPAAALKTLEVMEKSRSWETITNIGAEIKSRWQDLADNNDLAINQFGIASLAGFNFLSENALAYKTLITQEMLKHNFLASNLIYASVTHRQDNIDEYFSILDRIFSLVRECEDGRDINDLLDGRICDSGFKRLN